MDVGYNAIWHLDLLQVLTVLTMERPVSFSAEDIRDEKVTNGHPAGHAVGNAY
jgi:hypothetical protein